MAAGETKVFDMASSSDLNAPMPKVSDDTPVATGFLSGSRRIHGDLMAINRREQMPKAKNSVERRRSRLTHRGFFVLCACLAVGLIGCSDRTSIIVKSEPSGAEVHLEGKMAGQTPLRVARNDVGSELTIYFKSSNSTTGTPSNRPKPKITRTLKCAYTPLTANLPLFVALEKGFFNENGLKVEAIEATTPNDIMTGIAGGQIDFAAVMAYPIVFPAALRFPGAFKLYSSSEETSTQFTSTIIAKKNSPLGKMQDLKGKKIGVYTGIVQINFLKAILAGAGIDANEVQIVEISPRLQIQGLISGQYDALSTTEPTANIAVIQGLAKIISSNPRVKYIMNPFPSTAATISTRLIQEDAEAAKAVVRGLDMAVDFIRSNPEEAKKHLLKYTPIPKDIAGQVLADLRLFRYCKLGEENRLNVQRFADFMRKTGLLDKPIDDVNVLFGDYEEAPRE